MKVAVIGSGGREDALCWKISKSPNLNKLFAIPGNPGTERYSINVPLDVNDYKSILSFCKDESIDLVVIGPEAPLVNGLSNLLRDNGVNVFGPNKFPAQLEGSKVFAKNLMQKYNIPTASYQTFTSAEYKKVIDHLKRSNFPTVIKADGLAAGKGVSICNDFDSARQIIEQIFIDKKFGDSGNKIVIEEFLSGEEVSIFVITDGINYTLLTPAQDYKKIYDGDKGKNTGGMGSFAFKKILSDEQLEDIEQKIVQPTLNAIKLEGEPYIGCLYCGLIVTNDGIKVIEFNCRFGDPEIQAVVMTIDEDFLSLLYNTARGELKSRKLNLTGSAICLVLASEGYPDAFQKGFEISGLESIKEFDSIEIFHAGTRKLGDKILTNGGRVLNLVAYSSKENFSNLISRVYSLAEKINFQNKYFRKDIGLKGIPKFNKNSI